MGDVVRLAVVRKQIGAPAPRTCIACTEKVEATRLRCDACQNAFEARINRLVEDGAVSTTGCRHDP
ncbi:hypothetical protein CH341_16950 [Rhodoplanes roseus]|uniref:Uncharacterized protein n=1 Tax=Rhodoplanes roseus TaxID=29409 RepID=A0A327L084_9BRAD|nr:hypothetical protein CH341_16950 [Rhodoplanes roseus]